jgi:REP element-mobilizing transposase RayT
MFSHLLFITIVTKNRFPLFDSGESTTLFANELLHGQSFRNFTVISFIFMPDHVHILIETKDIAMHKIIQVYKSITYHLLRDRFSIKEKFWQRSFDWREVKDINALQNVFDYIKNNPRKISASIQYFEYPYYFENKPALQNALKQLSPINTQEVER